MASLFTSATGHILSYGTLLGTTFFHTFVGSLVAYQNLNRAQFGALMGKIFPIYFSIQTLLPAVLAFTFPRSTSTPAGIHGLLDAANRWGGLVPITTMFLSALANAAVIGPATTKCMYQRKLQERKDGKKSTDPPPHSQEMEALNKKFGALHGISSILNLAGFIATIAYGAKLASRFK